MENQKPKYYLTDHSKRLANLIKDQVQVSSCLQKALRIQDSALDEITCRMLELLLDMIGVEDEGSEYYRDDFKEHFFDFCDDEITLDELMRLANDQAQ